jgi:acetolactate synthase-1/2/3 large subunit
MIKYSDQVGMWLKELGYTHYFYVGGGNIMHLTESLSRYLSGIPVVHEVAAGIAAEYFNEMSGQSKALALVTTGPGLTNIVTAISGAYLESRELLVIGGQVKTADLASPGLRSRGIQEVNGVELVRTTTKVSYRFMAPISAKSFFEKVSASWRPRKGPVFLEMPLDVQAIEVEPEPMLKISNELLPKIFEDDLVKIVNKYNDSKKPVLLIGGGVDYKTAKRLQDKFDGQQIPTMTTYNGIDRIDGNCEYYLGRPNTWGQRSSNIIIQQADLILAVGTRLGLQQTGFNWQEFGRDAVIYQMDIDESELSKGHPNISQGFRVDANDFIERFLGSDLVKKQSWLSYAQKIRSLVPRIENVNKTNEGYISPYQFILDLESLTNKQDVIIPCSSGSAFTLTMQIFRQRFGQRLLTNKSLASMGYGLSGAIGAAIAHENSQRTILIEGDGGFAQNMQELGTAEVNNLNLKMFIFNDQGHASIRMTQINYFGGKYLGCDRKSGLGLPNWFALFGAWNIPVMEVGPEFASDIEFLSRFNGGSLQAFLVKIDPEQTYFPKISSRITHSGSMESNPIDKMSPEIDYLSGLAPFNSEEKL